MKKNTHHTKSSRGVVLIVAVLFASVALSIGVALASLGSEQLSLSKTTLQSQEAFYAADAMLSCLRFNVSLFEYDNYSDTVLCPGPEDNWDTILYTPTSQSDGSIRFDTVEPWYPMEGGGCATFSIVKNPYTIDIYASGKNAGPGGSCTQDASQVIERVIHLRQ